MRGPERPALVFADSRGQIIEFAELEMVGAHAGRWVRLQPGDWIPLPEGSELFMLPDRVPVGFDPSSGQFVVLDKNPYDPSFSAYAVAAFVAPAHTVTHLAAYRTRVDAKVLPLFSYAAVGWYKNTFVTTAIRVDPDERQDYRHFNLKKISSNARKIMKAHQNNRLIQHLGRCALSYACPAARNFFMRRWEAPLPSSPVCNARCLGCISHQEHPDICVSQERIRFVPTPDEIAEVALTHLHYAEDGIVSFGQGCEGEPLLQAKTLEKAVKIIRSRTQKGTINVNTNASIPEAVDRLFNAGVDSIRVSMNSARQKYYKAYHRPVSYSFEDVKESIKVAKTHGRFVSLNYFIFPGFTDDPDEISALLAFLDECPVDLIQMRNFNIDPEWYLQEIDFSPGGPPVGIRKWMKIIKQHFPQIRFGYFNPRLR